MAKGVMRLSFEICASKSEARGRKRGWDWAGLAFRQATFFSGTEGGSEGGVEETGYWYEGEPNLTGILLAAFYFCVRSKKRQMA